MNPKAEHVTLQSGPTLGTLFLKASVAWRFTHTHHETQVQLPYWSPLPPPPLFPHPPTEEHMSPITVLLSQHTIKAQLQTLLVGLYSTSLLLHMANSLQNKSDSDRCLNLGVSDS